MNRIAQNDLNRLDKVGSVLYSMGNVEGNRIVRAGNLYSTAMLQGCLIGMLTMRRVWGERGDSGLAQGHNNEVEK